MFAILLTVATGVFSPEPSSPHVRPFSIVQSRSFEQRLKDAGEDADELWSLYLWCDAGGRTKEGNTVLRKIVDVDPNHREANTALGHLEYRGRWFRNQRKLDLFKEQEEEREALEQGLVRFHDEWVPKRDVPYLEQGLVRGPDGGWVTPEELVLLEDGWVRQDLEWIEPGEVENIERGLWKCGDEWLPLAEANHYHARLGQWWRFASAHFVVFSTMNRDQALAAATELDLTHDDLVRAYGRVPEDRPVVILLRSSEQYTQFAKSGYQGRETDGSGVASVHHAYLADQGLDIEAKQFWGAGVAFWDNTNEAGSRFGRLAARHAAGQAFSQAIDASPKAIARAEKKPERGVDLSAFYKEKALPAWFRFGAAAYVERYFVDGLVAADGDPFWPKAWSVENLNSRGGPIPLSMFFERRLDVNDPEAAARWINQSGLLMAFVLDGRVDDIVEAHSRIVEGLRKGKRMDKLVLALEASIQEHEEELRAFMAKP